jgi:hypothetical protein
MRILRALRWVAISIILFLISLLTINALSYLNFSTDYGFLALKQKAVASSWYLPAYYSHVTIGGLILLIGFFQLFTKYSLRFPKVHKYAGRFYVYGILLFSAPGGLIMSFFIDRGNWVLSSFILQSMLWFVLTIIGLRKIINQDITEHRKWMIRSYALTFAAVTLRLYVFIFNKHVELSSSQAYATIAWASWTINLLLVEIYLARHKRKIHFS